MATIRLPHLKRHKSLKEALSSATAQATEQHDMVVAQLRDSIKGGKDLWTKTNKSSFKPKT